MRECIASYEAWTVVGNVKTGNGLFSFCFAKFTTCIMRYRSGETHWSYCEIRFDSVAYFFLIFAKNTTCIMRERSGVTRMSG